MVRILLSAKISRRIPRVSYLFAASNPDSVDDVADPGPGMYLTELEVWDVEAVVTVDIVFEVGIGPDVGDDDICPACEGANVDGEGRPVKLAKVYEGSTDCIPGTVQAREAAGKVDSVDKSCVVAVGWTSLFVSTCFGRIHQA